MRIFTFVKRVTAFAVMLLVGGCVRVPDGIEPVESFDVNRYLGTWYEIARLDHSFERGLEQVTAEYSFGDKGEIQVINRGYDPVAKKWKEAQGRAYFVDSSEVGMLKVSFFGPFYGGYNIVALDRENYSYALVCGPTKKYLWILSRSPVMDKAIVQELVAKAKKQGFDTDSLIYVKHGSQSEKGG